MREFNCMAAMQGNSTRLTSNLANVKTPTASWWEDLPTLRRSGNWSHLIPLPTPGSYTIRYPPYW